MAMTVPSDAEWSDQAAAFDVLEHHVKALDRIICNMSDIVDMTDELDNAKKKTDKDDDLAHRMKMQRQVRAYRALDTLMGEAVRQSAQLEGQLADFLEVSPKLAKHLARWQAET
jgi:predicted  nucleic acid-binding Zn-ribbon protein